jgi:hypothetical protein
VTCKRNSERGGGGVGESSRRAIKTKLGPGRFYDRIGTANERGEGEYVHH